MKKFPIIFFLLLFPALGLAQSVMVISNNEAARKCYMDATIISTVESAVASNNMLVACNAAIDQYGLRDEDRAATFANRGVILAALGELAKAMADYDKALSLSPEVGEVYISRGMVFHFEGQFEHAVDNYTRAIDLQVRRPYIAYFDRALAYEEMGKLTAAVADYRRALEMRPGWPAAENRLEWVMQRIDEEGPGPSE